MNPPISSPQPEVPQIIASGNDLQARKDTEHLKWLSLAAYIWGGISAFFSSFGLIHFFLGLAMVSGQIPASSDDGEISSALVGWMFVIMGAFVVLGGWTVGGLTAYAGRCIARREKKTLIQVMAALNCLSIPVGTLWGVFTFVVLSRPSVAARFDAKTRHPY